MRTAQVHGGPCNNEAATATFTTKRIYQSSCYPGCNNTITVEIMANVRSAHCSPTIHLCVCLCVIIHVYGFSLSLSLDPEIRQVFDSCVLQVPIPAHSSQKIVIEFGLTEDVCIVKYDVLPYFTPSWTPSTLTLVVQQDMMACTHYNITFTVTNAVAKHSFSPKAQTLISAVGNIAIPSEELEQGLQAGSDSDSNCDKPFEVERPAFDVKSIGQSTPYPGTQVHIRIYIIKQILRGKCCRRILSGEMDRLCRVVHVSQICTIRVTHERYKTRHPGKRKKRERRHVSHETRGMKSEEEKEKESPISAQGGNVYTHACLYSYFLRNRKHKNDMGL